MRGFENEEDYIHFGLEKCSEFQRMECVHGVKDGLVFPLDSFNIDSPLSEFDVVMICVIFLTLSLLIDERP